MFRKIVKSIIPDRLWDQTRLIVSKQVTLHRVRDLLKSKDEIKLEIGAGSVKGKNGWITLDLKTEADLFWDLREGLPFSDNSISMIYSSHVLEHFYYPELMKLLRDCLRTLKPGGIFSACVPNAGIYLNGYHNFSSFDRSCYLEFTPALHSDLRMDLVNYIAYMDGRHKYMFDEENLVHVLKQAGFGLVRLREFDPRLDLLKRKSYSLFVCCSK